MFGCYSIRVAGNAKTDRHYLINYIPSLFEKVFNEKGNLHFSKISKVGYFTIYGKNFVNFIKSKGIKSGNKKRNNQTIPRCIKGLMDTDGSVHYISKHNLNLRISYTSHIPSLLGDVRYALISLGFSPSKIIKERQIFLSSKKDSNKYINEIGFSNRKNLNRLKLLKKQMPL